MCVGSSSMLEVEEHLPGGWSPLSFPPLLGSKEAHPAPPRPILGNPLCPWKESLPQPCHLIRGFNVSPIPQCQLPSFSFFPKWFRMQQMKEVLSPGIAKSQHRENKEIEWKRTKHPSTAFYREESTTPTMWNWPALQVEKQLHERTPEMKHRTLFLRQCSVMKSCQSAMIQKKKKYSGM